MFKKINSMINNVFGEKPWEKSLKKTENKDILRLLKVISLIRFFVFPISVLIYLIGISLELLITSLLFLHNLFLFLFEIINDSIWINSKWFNLASDDINNEIDNLNKDMDLKNV